MNRYCRRICVILVVLLLVAADIRTAEAQPAVAPSASPQASQAVALPQEHAGNVFLLGEVITVALPTENAVALTSWRALDDHGHEVAHGSVTKQLTRAGERVESGQHVVLGKLGVGWFRVEWCDSDKNVLVWTTAAVLAPLGAKPPEDSPVCVDAAISWFARDDVGRQANFAYLAALAGVRSTRDRLRWRDVQPAADQLASSPTTYDTAAELQGKAGLHVLQVFHDTPAWAAGADGQRGRFPDDLRHVYRFCQAMARRFAGKVEAWEPWNEANVADFGAHTMDEICAYQKAAYLGFKSGDKGVTVCWNATTGVPTDRQTAGVLNNEAWPYFDTFNIHSYDWPTSYQQLWEPVRRAASGKPIWVTESDRGMTVAADSPTHELTARNERLKAEYMAQSYALSLHAGAARHFHFILGQYGERDVEFGLLRHDFTPRPAFVALAALGRMLSGARCLGRYVVAKEPDTFVIAFSALPDGKRRDVLVAWSEQSGDWPQRGERTTNWPLPNSLTVEWCCDYLGRRLGPSAPQKLTSAPTFVVLPAGEASRLSLDPPGRSAPRSSSLTDNSPSPVVLQCLLPRNTAVRDDSIPWAWEYEHHLAVDAEHELPLFVYNFTDKTVTGTIALENTPLGYQVTPSRWQVKLVPMERQRLPAQVRIATSGDTAPKAERWLILRGDFAEAGRPVLALQLFEKSK